MIERMHAGTNEQRNEGRRNEQMREWTDSKQAKNFRISQRQRRRQIIEKKRIFFLSKFHVVAPALKRDASSLTGQKGHEKILEKLLQMSRKIIRKIFKETFEQSFENFSTIFFSKNSPIFSSFFFPKSFVDF